MYVLLHLIIYKQYAATFMCGYTKANILRHSNVEDQ